VKIGFKFQTLGKISNISTSDPVVLLGQFQHCFLLTYFVLQRLHVYSAAFEHSVQ